MVAEKGVKAIPYGCRVAGLVSGRLLNGVSSAGRITQVFVLRTVWELWPISERDSRAPL